ncbi:MAG: LLM class F420-dependent oxidoreductase [Dehalococcoidia bacterium]
MRIGLQVPYFTWLNGPPVGEAFGGVAQRAEAAGFDSLWVMDHFFQIPGVGPPEFDMLESYTTLGFAAAKTSRIKLGTMVTGVTYRHPGILVKTATTLDVLSGGRAYFGIGAAWFDREHAGLGVPFPPLKQRFEMLEETLQIAGRMWSDNNGPYEGAHYQLAETLSVPQPVSKPHPPILIGGRGEKKTLRLVARYADAWNMGTSFNDDGVAEFKRLSGVLRAHCEREGRAYGDIEKTVLTTLMVRLDGGGRWLSPAQAIAQFQDFAEAGVDQVIVNMPHVEVPETLDFLAARGVPEVHKLQVRA